MKAITVEPRKPDSARLEDVPEPDVRDGSVLVEAIAVGVCGTDVEILEASTAGPPGARRAWCSVTNLSAASQTRAKAVR
jgi:threonine dehydrogenase-like Zn-dependent dehydrogenase